MDTKLTILIVEDAEIIRKKIIRSLSTITEVEIIDFTDNAIDAIEKINLLKPDLITLDLRLRIGNGWEVMKAIKEMENPPKVIVLTNYSDYGIVQKSIEAGADYFLDKSDEFEKLADVCEEIIQQLTITDFNNKV